MEGENKYICVKLPCGTMVTVAYDFSEMDLIRLNQYALRAMNETVGDLKEGRIF